MNRSSAWLLAPGALVLFVACSGSAPGTDGTGGAGTGGNQATGGTHSGGTEGGGSGGSQQGSGGATAASGGAPGTGGRGDLAPNECTDAHGCGEGATCYAPDQPPPAICGAPQWCGQCSCPAMPFVPEGSGQPCGDACPSVSDAILRAASICDTATDLCTECLADEDCGDSLPYCDTEATSGTRMCFQCDSDDDCSDETPVCFKLTVPTPSAFGMCRQCRTDTDCLTGACDINGACVPDCTTDAQCGPNRICAAERCVPQPCVDDDACSSQSSCSDTSCRPVSCTNDDACPGGYCINGGCYETPGGCMFDTAG